MCHILSFLHLSVCSYQTFALSTVTREKQFIYIVRDAVFVCKYLIPHRKCIFHNNRLSSEDELQLKLV
jgi:hypothetical protein